MYKIYIDSREGTTNIAIVEKDKLTEFHIEKEDQKKSIGSIYRARVENVLKGMEAAFVNIGQGKHAYLHIKDAIHKNKMDSNKRPSIDELIKSGSDIIVQISKEPIGSKGAKVTANITIPGRYLVLLPYANEINISRKISDDGEIEKLKNIGRDMIIDGIGMIFRTSSAGVDEGLILEEYRSLIKIFKKIESQRNFLPTPKLIYKNLGLVYRLIRDSLNRDSFQIIVNNREIHNHIIQFGEYLNYPLEEYLILDKSFTTDYNLLIQEGLQEALGREVALKSGGYIVMDKTEALTVIDVNTGKFVGTTSLEETVFKTNMEAAEEIARQLKLRNIGGIIVVDFIDMKDSKDVSMLLSSLENHFKSYKNKANIVGITGLGLVEITRKRTSPSLESYLTTKCPTCLGRGRINNKMV